ncbi:hypothetical protein DMC47_10645 [Nostoc sp. 3335mG]|nr:hypothetical protein DMC47_10645 [Nostoc sp. 3335mG]
MGAARTLREGLRSTGTLLMRGSLCLRPRPLLCQADHRALNGQDVIGTGPGGVDNAPHVRSTQHPHRTASIAWAGQPYRVPGAM